MQTNEQPFQPPNPPAGGSWRWDDETRNWISTDPAPEEIDTTDAQQASAPATPSVNEE